MACIYMLIFVYKQEERRVWYILFVYVDILIKSTVVLAWRV